MAKNAIVVARYKEDIRWLSYLGRKPEWEVFVYNDGPDLNPFFTPNFTIYKGDGVPSEAPKYLKFICDNYNQIDKYKRIVFIQADPFDHSPDILGLLENVDSFNEPFQGLNVGHVFPWGPKDMKMDESIGNMRLWCEPFVDGWKGHWNDPLHPDSKVILNSITLDEFFEKFRLNKGDTTKWYAAQFAVTPEGIKRQTLEGWKALLNEASKNEWFTYAYREHGTKLSKHRKKRRLNVGRQFGFILEFVWCPLMTEAKARN